MSLAVTMALVRQPSHPDIGWGTLGLVCIQPIALVWVLYAGLFVVLCTRRNRRWIAACVAFVAALWVAFAFVGMEFPNSGC